MKLASRSVRSRPKRSRNFTNAVCASPKTTALPSTKNFVSMVSAWRVAMPFHMCEKRHWNSFPVSREVTSNAPTNVLMAPLLARTGREVTSAPFSFFSLSADRCGFGVRVRVALHGGADSCAGGHAQALIEQHLFQRGEEQQDVRFLAAVS